MRKLIFAAVGLLAPCLNAEPSHAATPTVSAKPAPAEPMDPKLAAKVVAKRHAATLSAAEAAAGDATLLSNLAAQHKLLKAELTTEQATLNKHLSAAKAAYPLRVAPPKPSKKPPPLPKVEALRKAQAEYQAVVDASARVAKAATQLSANEEQLEQHAESAADAAANAKVLVKEAQDAGGALATRARAADAPAELKDAAKLAQTQLKEARDAATKAGMSASKARSLSGMPSKAFYANQRAARERDNEKATAQLATVNVTLREASESLALQSPAVPHCNLSRMPWQDMTYPWIPNGSQNLPLTLHGNAPVCHETDPDECGYGTPNVAAEPLLGDLDGDGKPELALTMIMWGGDANGFETLVFAQDASCHLQYVGSVDFMNGDASLVGSTLVVDQPYAKRGENIGLGTATGSEHDEWRIVKGQLKQTRRILK